MKHITNKRAREILIILIKENFYLDGDKLIWGHIEDTDYNVIQTDKTIVSDLVDLKKNLNHFTEK